jgi:hypothetical protein
MMQHQTFRQLLLPMLACCLLACSKNEVPTEPTTPNLVQAVAGDQSINGLISTQAANEMQAAFIREEGPTATRLVKISVKDLLNFLHSQSANAMTDSLGIHTGIYTEATTPGDRPNYRGRLTIYCSVFTAQPKGMATMSTDNNNTFLNHGMLYP